LLLLLLFKRDVFGVKEDGEEEEVEEEEEEGSV
jgi:hypothetical protein